MAMEGFTTCIVDDAVVNFRWPDDTGSCAEKTHTYAPSSEAQLPGVFSS